MIPILAAVAMLAAPAARGQCGVVHGRMDLWNGTPSVRIWVVGTRRILGVEQRDESFGDLPPAIRRLWSHGPDADWNSSIFGDFRVCAATRSQPGRMQMVRLTGARRLVLRPRN